MLPQPLVELFWGYQYVNSFLSHQKFTLHHNLPFLVFYGIFIILYLLFYVYFISALFFLSMWQRRLYSKTLPSSPPHRKVSSLMTCATRLQQLALT